VSESWQALSLGGEEVRLTPCPGGPTLVRRADLVLDEDGTLYPVDRPVVALCTCGKSRRKPWCDSTHKSIRRDRRPAAE
jgi:CDGSH-type Zn-finger protein